MESTMNVQDLIKDIHDNLKQKSASRRDEVTVMRAMLNDKDFVVTDYATQEQHCPARDFRDMTANIIAIASLVILAVRAIRSPHNINEFI